MDMPKVSIIVPIYQVERYIKECIESILTQSLAEIEIILVDDGSMDSCPEICDAFAAIDSRIHVIHKKNEGLLAARISGIKAATAEYIGFLDGDDCIEKDYVKKMYYAASHLGAEMVCSSFTMFWENGDQEKMKWNFPEGFFDRAGMLKEIYPKAFYISGEDFHSCMFNGVVYKMFQRELLQQAINPLSTIQTRKLRIAEDMVITFSALFRAKSIYIMPCEYGYFYRQSSVSMMHTYWTDYLDNVALVESALESIPYPVGALSYKETGLQNWKEQEFFRILNNEIKAPFQDKEARYRFVQRITSDITWVSCAREMSLAPPSISMSIMKKMIANQSPVALRAFLLLKQRIFHRLRQSRYDAS